MNQVEALAIPFNARTIPSPAAREFFQRKQPSVPSIDDYIRQTNLLSAIHTALQGNKKTENSKPRTLYYAPVNDNSGEEELSWDTYNLLLSSGGVIRRRWNFKDDEKQPIQWACIGFVVQPSTVHTTSMRPDLATGDARKPTEDSPSSSSGAANRSTFGPFARIQREPKSDEEPASRCRAVFIFLRSLAKIYLLGNGQEHTFYLPFVVRRAWPVFPYGVIVQRILDPAEIEEAKASEDTLLPTIFSIVNAHAEPAVVGLSSGIVGGFDATPTSLKDDGVNKPSKSIPAEDIVLWTSPRGADVSDHIIVTLDKEKRQLSVWRYAYIPCKDLPDVPPTPRSPSSPSKQPSLKQSTNSTFPPGSPGQSIFPHQTTETVSLAALPGMPPALSSTTTMASIMQKGAAAALDPDISLPSVGTGRASLGGSGPVPPPKGDIDYGLDALGDSRIKTDYWAERLWSEEIPEADAIAWHDITVGVFDQRWNGRYISALLGICLPSRQTLTVFSLRRREGKSVLEAHSQLPGVTIAPVRALRPNVYDLLLLKPDYSLFLLTHGVREIPIAVESPGYLTDHVVTIQDGVESSVSLSFMDGTMTRTSFDLTPNNLLTQQTLFLLSLVLPADFFFTLHKQFLVKWSARGYSSVDEDTFDSLRDALFEVLSIPNPPPPHTSTGAWQSLNTTSSFARHNDDPALQRLQLPPSLHSIKSIFSHKPHEHTAVILHALHYLGLNLWINVRRHRDLLTLARVICRLAIMVRPEWADFWKRICPDALDEWPSPLDPTSAKVDDRLPAWPPDLFSCLYNRINNPDFTSPWLSTAKHAAVFGITPSLAFGAGEPLRGSRDILQIYSALADGKVLDSRKRAEKAILIMAKSLGAEGGQEFFDSLPLGLMAPLKEAARACQLSPSGDWPLNAFKLIGRNDVVELVSSRPDLMFDYGYRSVKDYLSNTTRKSINDVADDVRRALPGEMNVSGVELGLKDFIDIRFAQDRRIEEISRMLCSSTVTTIKAMERPDMSEVDQAREMQNQVLRLTERTLTLPFGRAMLTFGTVTVVTRETYRIPRMEYTARLQQQNLAMVPDATKLSPEVVSWAEFHNGVAAGLRISHSSTAVDSSWIKFNKPAELTPEHAGFLFALGLTGHLRELLTWHTFSYLTPKHDLTTAAVLLGLSAAYAGSSDRHVTKLIAVHLPALLPTPNVDLNITLVMQAAALSSIGLLYMGTKNRRMAEVCISQIGRKDLVPPDLSNDFREACTLSAALAFGMVMLGKGSEVPADVALFERLGELIHGPHEGQLPVDPAHAKNTFDIHLTSPAASIALGLMYLKTSRHDIAETLVIPDTVLALDRIQPHYLLLRTLARSLIMWNNIAPSDQWLISQIPAAIWNAMQERFQGKTINDSFELAYYNIIAGCCFALGLKYAGTAREEAYALIVRYYDVFTRLAHTQSPTFDSKIKRAAINDGLNLISISLSLVMAGTGEVSCLRRFRYQYGKYNEPARYGTNVAISVSLGLLFLGGGRFTLGTSDAAIACMVAAFFPRFPQDSKENKSYLQALRHLWVLAVEPRCLIARDVDSKELVYVPIKMKVRDDKDLGTTQLICPTLIPEMDKIQSIRVDTPRYWPFYLDIARNPRHKESLLRSQVLYVKRRTAFLSYMEDPKGSRSLFVRSGSSTGDAATLDFPQSTDIRAHPAATADLHHFISSSSNDIYFLAFADQFCRDDGLTASERRLQSYCHAALLDSILQDKSWTIQAHLTLYRYRNLSPKHKYFNLALHDARFVMDFYTKVFERRFSGRSENNPRPALLRDTTLTSVVNDFDCQLDRLRQDPAFKALLRAYANGAPIRLPTTPTSTGPQLDLTRALAWYLQRHSVPPSSFLAILKTLALNSHERCLAMPPPHGTDRADILDMGIKEVLRTAGTGLVNTLGTGWNESSVDEILQSWR